MFLTWHSAENFAEYCLAYLFSARDFGDGTLGLAWMGTIAASLCSLQSIKNSIFHFSQIVEVEFANNQLKIFTKETV